MFMNSRTRSAKRPFFAYLVLASKGFCMGAADLVPGVSGGTMAFILGIYEDLLNAIKSFDLSGLRLIAAFRLRAFMGHVSWEFLLSVGIGILTAIFTLSKGLSWLLQNRPVLIWSFFLGLILASVITVSRRVEKWRVPTWLSLTGGATGIYILVGLVPGTTPDDLWFLFVSGAVAICAMILPGISGSFILVLMGKYQYVLQAVTGRDFLVLFVVAAGACAGIVAFSRLLTWLLNRYHDLMVAFLTGLMIGSVRKIWPWKETLETLTLGQGKTVPVVQGNILPHEWNGEVLFALCLMGLGFLVVLVMDRMAEER